MLSQISKNQFLFINFLLCALPISYILGNTVLNSNIIIIIIISFILFRLEIFKIKFHLIDFLLILFFSYIFFNGIYNNFFNSDLPIISEKNIILYKSIMFLRFLLFYFVLRFLVEKNFINYKYLFLSYGIICLFVALDVIIQFSIGKDIFGFESMGRRNPGPFGDEPIAGVFIQRFLVFLLFYFVIFSYKNIKFNNTLLFILSIICIFGAILAGNRVSVVMVVLTFGFLFAFEKSLRKILTLQFLIGVLAFTIIMKNPTEIRSHYKRLYNGAAEILIYIKSKITSEKIYIVDGKLRNIHLKEIESGLYTWQENKFFGGGIKSFRWVCNNIDRSKVLHLVSTKGPVNCNNHPHHFYIQIAAELGLVGLLIFVSLILLISLKFILVMFKDQKDTNSKRLLFLFFILFFNEIFPLKTAGSFFTTSNAYFIFFVLPFLSSFIKSSSLTYEK